MTERLGSHADAPTEPNLVGHPDVAVRVRGEQFAARARSATPEEKQRFRRIMTRRWPNDDVDATRTDPDITVVVLEPAGGSNGE